MQIVFLTQRFDVPLNETASRLTIDDTLDLLERSAILEYVLDKRAGLYLSVPSMPTPIRTA